MSSDTTNSKGSQVGLIALVVGIVGIVIAVVDDVFVVLALSHRLYHRHRRRTARVDGHRRLPTPPFRHSTRNLRHGSGRSGAVTVAVTTAKGKEDERHGHGSDGHGDM